MRAHRLTVHLGLRGSHTLSSEDPQIVSPSRPLRAPTSTQSHAVLWTLHTDEGPTDPLSIQATEGPTYLLAKSLTIPRASHIDFLPTDEGPTY